MGRKSGLVVGVKVFAPRLMMAALLIACGVSTTLAAQETPTIEIVLHPETTTIHWTLKSLLHTSQGNFSLKAADIVVNAKTGLAQGEVLVDATSATGNDAKQTARWQKDVLDSGTYPAILFHPSKVEGLTAGKGEQQVKASGTMTLRGQDHPIDIPLSVELDGKDATIISHFTVPYAAWGFKPPSAGLGHYDKQVVIDVKAQGMVKLQKTTPSAAPSADSQ